MTRRLDELFSQSFFLQGYPMNYLLSNKKPNILLRFIQQLDKLNCHSLVIYQNNELAVETYWQPYNKNQQQIVYSVSKSFTAVAMMFAMQEGILNENTLLYDVLKNKINFLPDKKLLAVTVKDLLSMRFGYVDKEPQLFYLQPDWIKEAFQLQPQNEPGTEFFYDNRCPFLCAAILKELTGEDIYTYLQPRLFKPLDITDVSWEKNSQNYNPGAWGLSIRTTDLAKFGLFLLNKGNYKKRQLLDEKYIKKLFSVHVSTQNCQKDELAIDSIQGYSYYFWKCAHKHAFRAAGLFGQYCLILPDENIVIAMTCSAARSQTQSILSTVWNFINSFTTTIKLTAKQPVFQKYAANLTIPFPVSQSSAKIPLLKKSFIFIKNKLGLRAITIIPANNSTATIKMELTTKTIILNTDFNRWQKNKTGDKNQFDSCSTVFYNSPFAAYNYSNNHFNFKLVYNQGPFIDTFLLTWKDNNAVCHYIPSPRFDIRATEEFINGYLS